MTPAGQGYAGLLRVKAPFLVLGLLALLAAWWCHYQAGQTARELTAFVEGRAGLQKQGFTLWRYRAGDWTRQEGPVRTMPGLDLNQSHDSIFKGHDFNLRALAFLRLPKLTEFELGFTSDDGGLLLVDGKRVIDNLGIHPPRRLTARVSLKPGGHVLEVLYFQAKGGAALKLELPRELQARLHPVSPDISLPRLWLLDRRVEIQGNRVWLLTGLGLLTLIFYLLPLGRRIPGRFKTWLIGHWPHMALLAVFTLLCGLNINSSPGQDGDQAHFAITAWEWHWLAMRVHPWTDYTNQYFLIWPMYLAQQAAPFSLATLRWLAVIPNLAALLFLGLGLERLAGRRAALWSMALAGLSAWFLFSAREYHEMGIFGPLCAGLALYGLARAKDRLWGALLCAASLSLALEAHNILAVWAAGFGAGLLLALGPGLFRRKSFWLGVSCFLVLSGPWLYSFATASVDHPGHNLGPWELLLRAGGMLTGLLPNTMSGSQIALYWTGQETWPIPPLVPLATLSALMAWPFMNFETGVNRVLRGLLAAALAVFALLALKIPNPELRYMEFVALPLMLWLGVFLANAAKALPKARKIFYICGALLVLLNVYVYLLPCQYTFMRTGGVYLKFPGMRFHSDRKMEKRALYQALAKLGYPVYFDYWDSRALSFHELEDATGRKGLVLPVRRVPGMVVLHYKAIKDTPPDKDAKRLPLGPELDRKFSVFLWD